MLVRLHLDNIPRLDTISHDSALSTSAFRKLSLILEFKIDIFAVQWNAQLLRPMFLPYEKNLQAFLFPPFNLIPRCLTKIRSDLAEVTITCPFWLTQFWFPDLLKMSIDTPRMLLYRPDLLLSCKGNRPSLIEQQTLHLFASRLSGQNTKTEDYRRSLLNGCNSNMSADKF